MFCVMFEVDPRLGQRDAYLGLAKMLRPELVKADGFIDNIRYELKRRPGWLLSLSAWRDGRALIRWRTHAQHHQVQAKGRLEIFQDYRIRVGQITADSHDPEGHGLFEQHLDETETGAAKLVSVVEMVRSADLPQDAVVETIANRFGLSIGAEGLVERDVFDAILTPGDLLLLASGRDAADATQPSKIPAEARHREVRILRDYGMFERTEAPQYFASVSLIAARSNPSGWSDGRRSDQAVIARERAQINHRVSAFPIQLQEARDAAGARPAATMTLDRVMRVFE